MAKAAARAQEKSTGFVRGLGLLDSTMIVAGSMIGSGIFIVSADIAREVGAPGWLLVVWLVTGLECERGSFELLQSLARWRETARRWPWPDGGRSFWIVRRHLRGANQFAFLG